MNSITDICKYHFLCFVTTIQVKVISGHQVKKVKLKKLGFRAAIHVFGQIFTKNTKNDPITLLSIEICQKINLGKSQLSPEMW